MTDLADLQVMVAQDLRDPDNGVWATEELTDLINAGIDSLSDIYPREVVDASLTISASVSTYTLPSDFMRVFHVDVLDSTGELLGTYPGAESADTDSGWKTHAGILWIAPHNLPAAGSKLRLFGYGRYTQLVDPTDDTDLDTTGIWAIRKYAKAEAWYALLYDRGLFQQWSSQPTNVDTSATQMLQLATVARRTWEDEKVRLRRIRRVD